MTFVEGGLRKVYVVYLTGARLIRSTGLVHGDPYLTGVRKVDVVYFRGTSRKKYRRGRGRTYGWNGGRVEYTRGGSLTLAPIK